MTLQKSPYEKWQDTINLSKTDNHWNDYDSDIKAATTQFNTHLLATKGYVALNWRLVKAMVWTESGGPNSDAWTSRPMQIGNPGDPGLGALLSNAEGGELILPPALKLQLTKVTANAPAMNIRAGIGYLLMRAATYETVSVEDAVDKKIIEITAKAGDNPSKIAAANKTTLDMLKKHNPKITVTLNSGDKIKIQKASMQKRIRSWAIINTQFCANKYNIGDSLYAKKLDYCLSLIN